MPLYTFMTLLASILYPTHRTKTVVFLLTALWCFTHAWGRQEHSKPFTHLTTSNGLSDVSVYAIIRDANGYMWFGTQEGLNKYNGSDIQQYYYKYKDTLSIPDNNIKVLSLDLDSNLWIGTNGGGICRYDPEIGAFHQYRPGIKDGNLKNGEVWAIEPDDMGFLWVGTTEGLYKFSPAKGIFQQYMPKEDISALVYDKAGTLWIAAFGKGVFKIDTRDSAAKPQKIAIPSRYNANLLKYGTRLKWKDSKLWIGSKDQGLIVYQPIENHWQIFNKRNSRLSNNYIRGISFDKADQVWIGTDKGLHVATVVMNGLQFEEVYQHQLQNDQSIADNSIRAIYNDRNGHLWVGTRVEGVDRIQLEESSFYQLTEDKGGLPSNIVRSLLTIDNDSLWVGTDGGGLVKVSLTTGMTQEIAEDERLQELGICDLMKDSKGDLWIGTRQGLAVKRKGEKGFELFRYSEEDSSTIPAKEVFAIAEDKNGEIWVGTGKGMAVYQGEGKFQRVNSRNSNLPYDDINAIEYDDLREVFWVGTYGKGLIRYDVDEDISYLFPQNLDIDHRLRNASITSILIDDDGSLWLTSYKDGVFHVSPEDRFVKQYLNTSGLSSNTTFGILKDKKGTYWISTTKGISKLDVETETWTKVNTEDGLPTNAFNYGGLVQTESGMLVFTSLDGLIYFHPDSVEIRNQVPKVGLAHFKLNNQEVEPGPNSPLKKVIDVAEEIRLEYDEDYFSIGYTALSYKTNQKYHYAYRLEGLESEWNYVQDRKEAFYTHIPSGKYTFMVKAVSTGDGKEGEISSIKIFIASPIWETWWFLGGVALFMAGLAWLLYTARINAIKRNNILLEELVEARTQEVVQQKEEMATQADTLRKANEYIQGQNSQLQEKQAETEEAYLRIRAITEIGKSLTGQLSIQRLIMAMHELLPTIMRVDGLGIGVKNPMLYRLEYSGFIELGEVLEFHHDSLEDKQTLGVYAFQQKEPLMLNNVPEEAPSLIQWPMRSSTDRIPLSVLYIPLLLEGEAIGVLAVQSFEINVYSDKDMSFLMALSTYVAAAVGTARAFQTIKERNGQITDSIRYAQTIQKALLPSLKPLRRIFEDYFIYYQPKDIVSGDFYWTYELPHQQGELIVVADCTGHGVPGAFMSMIGHRILTEAVQDRGLAEPNEILEFTDTAIRNLLKQDTASGNRDGMDIAVCRFQEHATAAEWNISFSGAKLGFFYQIEDKGVNMIRPTRRSIGGATLRRKKSFEKKEIQLPKGTQIYITTDGLLDQNSFSASRLGRKAFVEMIYGLSHEPSARQREAIKELVEERTSRVPQRDDITVLGLKL